MIETLLLGVALPATTALVILLVGWRPWRRPPAALGPFSGPVAIGAAVILSFVSQDGVPSVPPAERWQWIVPLVLAAVVIDLALATVRRRSERGAAFTVGAAIALGAAASLMLRLPDLDTWPARGAVGAAVAAAALIVDVVAARRPGPLLPIALSIAATAVSILLILSHNAKLAIIAGGLSAACGSAALVALLDRTITPFRGGALVAGATIVALAACGIAYDYGDVGLAPFLLVAAGLLALVACESPPLARMRGFVGWCVRLGPVLLTSGAAVAWVLMTKDGADGGGYGGY